MKTTSILILALCLASAEAAPPPTSASLYDWIVQFLKLPGNGGTGVRGGEVTHASELWLISLSNKNETLLYRSNDSLWTPAAISDKSIAFVQSDGIWTVDTDTKRASLKVGGTHFRAIIGAINDHTLLVALEKVSSNDDNSDIALVDLSSGLVSRSTDMPSGNLSLEQLEQLLGERGLRNDTMICSQSGVLYKISTYSKVASPYRFEALTDHLTATITQYNRYNPSWLNDDTVIYTATHQP